MTFWDGRRWIRLQPTADGPARSPAAWIATAIMILGLAAIVVPIQDSTGSTGVAVRLSPQAATAGERVVVMGEGLRPRARIQLLWDGASSAMPHARADSAGRFSAQLRVPRKAVPGDHLVSVTFPGSRTAFAQAMLRVLPSVTAPTPTAVPTPEPATPTPTPRATASPTATPKPTPQPTPQPTPVPATPAPTPVPVTPVPATPAPAPPAGTLLVPSQYGSIQAAINAAQPGQTVEVAPGVYAEELRSVRAGVSVRGYGAALRGKGIGRPSTTGGTYLLIHITHSNVTFAGFELTNAWRGARIEGAAGSSLVDLSIHHVGRTGIEISHGAVGAVVRGARISNTGLAGEGNAEAIYVGTARSADSWAGPDLTRDGVIAGNVLGPAVAEGIDIKDDVTGFLVTGNSVTGAWEVDSGAINVRGHHNRIEANNASGNSGSGIRFGGDPASPATANAVHGNVASNNGAYGFKFIDGPQTASGNTGSGNGKGLAFYGGAHFSI